MPRYDPALAYPALAAWGDVEPGIVAWNRFGSNADVDATPAEDVWPAGGIWLSAPNTAHETVNVVSTSAADDVASTGARTVTIYGLDRNYAATSETLDMDGVTPVASSGTYIVVYRIVVATRGSGAGNAGVITATGGTSGYVYAHIAVGDNQTLQATHCTPADHDTLLYEYYAGVAGAVSANVDFTLLVYGVDSLSLWRPQHKITTANGLHVSHKFSVPLYLPPKTYVKVQADSDAANTAVFAGFDMVVREQ